MCHEITRIGNSDTGGQKENFFELYKWQSCEVNQDHPSRSG
jgi:hypothetical protein